MSNVFETLLLRCSDKAWNWDNWEGVSQNPNVTMWIIEKHPDKPWDWYEISRHPNLTMEMINKHPDKPWDWSGISQNPNLTWEIIEKHPNKPWDWDEISWNPNVTMEMIESNVNKIDWCGLSWNMFDQHPHLQKRRRNPSKKMRQVLNELHQVSDAPPLEDHPKPVFRKGGAGFWETWRQMNVTDLKVRGYSQCSLYTILYVPKRLSCINKVYASLF